ncbi:MAG: hypothetical protein RIR01_1249 [Bacteroidota bacterium]|jgi:hypothetical protein
MANKTSNFIDNSPPKADATWLNMVTKEIANAIPMAGDVVDSSAGATVNTQLLDCIKSYVSQAGILCTDTSSGANVYVVNASTPFTNPVLKTGTRIRFKTANANTGSSTIAAFGGSAVTCKKSDGSTNLVANDIPTNSEVEFVYNGTNWIKTLYGLATTTNQGVSYLNNPITITNNATNPNTQMDIGAGIVDYDNGSGQLLCQAMTKTLQSSGSWTAGNNQNGLDTGARANSTWYNIFQIVKNSDNTSDILYSTSRTAPNVPSGYTLVAWIKRIRTDASGNIDPNQYSIRTSYGQLHHYRNPNFASGTTTIPFDNTTPQNTEGTEFMTTNFVPIKAFSKIEIDCNMFVAISVGNVANLNALFKSGNANALTAGYCLASVPDGGQQTTLKYVDILSSTSAVDYSVRCGGSGPSTVYFNGISSGARFNGTFYSSITIKEYL